MVSLLKINKKAENKLDQAKILVSIYCLVSGLKISETDATVLAYYMVYKDNKTAKDLILKSGLLGNIDSLSNTLTKLRNAGLIKKSLINKESMVTENLNITLDSVVGVIVKIDNR